MMEALHCSDDSPISLPPGRGAGWRQADLRLSFRANSPHPWLIQPLANAGLVHGVTAPTETSERLPSR